MRRLTAERAREVLAYDPDTGVLTWRIAISNKTKVGAVAGNLNKTDGYVQIRIEGELHRAHRLAWLITTGAWPVGMIDHRNEVRSDNRWKNLRDFTKALNMQNRSAANSNSSSGLLGVSFKKNGGRPFAQITVSGKNVYLGTFDSPQLAHAAYLAGKQIYHSGCYAPGTGG